MSNENTEEFIAAVQCHPYLYDLEDLSYKENVKKNKTWRQIATQFNMKHGNEAKRKWRNLKDSYNKYKKSTTVEAYKKYKNWPWSEYMQFLDDFNRPRRQSEDSLSNQNFDVTGDIESESIDMSLPGTSSGSLSGKKKKHDEEVLIVEYDDDSLSTQNFDVTGDIEIESMDMSLLGPSLGSLSRKRKKHDKEMRMIKYFEKRRKETAVDHIDQLFLTYANTFKHMSSRTQISLKLKMAQMFAEAETEELVLKNTMLDNGFALKNETNILGS